MKIITILTLLLGLTGSLHAQDWPMWRYDAGRGASTPHALPAELQLQWTLQLESALPAWDHTQPKLHFDLAAEPVIMDGRLFVPSSRFDCLSAYDTKTGRALWQFDVEGPVRFAPVAWDNKVYFVSDDGYLYCVAADTGALVWKRNGGPADRWVIGNHRLVSSWPARGGPVLKDGVIYFAASIWPFMGIFIHAVDAETGATVWTNSGDGTNYTVQPHHASAFASIVPQGHLATSGDALVVPGGRSSPAIYDLKDGEFRHFEYDWRRGDHQVMAGPDAYYNASTALDYKNGSVLGSEMPVVFNDEAIIFRHGTKLTARSARAQWETREKKDKRGKKVVVRTLKQTDLYQQELADAGHIFLQAGEHIYSGALSKIAAHKLNGDAAPVWRDEIEGEVWSMIAGDQRLFVITRSNRIYCYGASRTEVVHHPIATKPFVVAREDWQGFASRVLKQPGTREGYTVILGAGSGQLVRALLEESDANMVVVEGNPDLAKLLRRELQANDLYGERICVRKADPEQAPLPPYLANLVVTEAREVSDAWLHSAWKALRPYGGTAAIPCTTAVHADIEARVKKLGFTQAQVLRGDGLTYIIRAGALPNTDDWTHQYGNAAQTVVSQDDLVKPPFGVLWFGGPPHDGVLPRHGHGPSPQVAAGRLVIEGADMLRAVDVYTGRLLWQRELKDLGTYYNRTDHFAGANEIGSNYVTLPDRVYAVYGPKLLELDAATGEEIRAYTLEKKADGERPNWGFLAVEGDYLVATSSPVPVDASKAKKTGGPPAAAGKRAIPKGAVWNYLATEDPASTWNQPGFDDTAWKTGKAGFGYGDNDDATELKLKNTFGRVYLRRSFNSDQVIGELSLSINFDDGFIAYLNGHEVARKQVKGSGPNATVSLHEAEGFETIKLPGAKRFLNDGKNILAIVGYNHSLNSSDFSLDPILLTADKNTPDTARDETPLPSGQFAPGSRRMLVFNRKTGAKLWERDAVFNWRHNNISISPDRVFCIDNMTDARMDSLKRRGISLEGDAAVYALDLATGEVLWQDREHVYGTFLNYSAKHDLVIQAGSSNRDRAKDETQMGITAFRGATGKVAWHDPTVKYGGPVLLREDEIITNGTGGFGINMLTGKSAGWKYLRQYGCNSAIGSKHVLTFRSGSAGFYDMDDHSGTSNIGGIRSSCTSNLIVANGVLNLPDYTRTCTCAYQNQTSLALVHMPEGEFWSFGGQANTQHIGLNLGAPGDRADGEGVLWYDVPSTGGNQPSEQLEVALIPTLPNRYRFHITQVSSGDPVWVTSSGLIGVEDIRIKVEAGSTWRMRLHFLEPESISPGERVFDVLSDQHVILPGLDIVREAGGPMTAWVKEVQVKANASAEIHLSFKATSGEAVISGIELNRL
ncbi:MAG: outer membrane protein assembly factor BamB [Kiritimatiellia bacterium]|jgi:outer membrane protein assembly factor BamB